MELLSGGVGAVERWWCRRNLEIQMVLYLGSHGSQGGSCSDSRKTLFGGDWSLGGNVFSQQKQSLIKIESANKTPLAANLSKMSEGKGTRIYAGTTFWILAIDATETEVIETRLVVEAARRFATRPFVTSSSLSMLSPNLAKDSSMVGGVDGLDDGGGVYKGWSG
nr:hypothetical protein [Tanacetum cinerariifolium]